MTAIDLDRYRRALIAPGAPWFSLAGLLARFPRGALSLGAILLVSGASGSYALGGAIAATFVVGLSLAGPVWARAMDRVGQRLPLLASAAALIVSTALLTGAVLWRWPVWTWFGLAAIAGVCCLDVGPAVRARWTALLAGDDRQSGFAIETIVDEILYVLAPPLVTVIAVAAAPASGLAVIVVIGAVGLAWLGVLTRSQPIPRGRERRARLVPPLGILPLVVAWIGVGAMFGAFDITAVAWAAELGGAWLTGVLMAAFALGNTVGAIVYGALTLRPSAQARWLALTALVAAAAVMLPLAARGLVLIGVVLLFGLVVGPLLVAGFALLESRVDRDRVTELLAYPSIGSGIGIPLGSMIAGAWIDAQGAASGFLIVTAAAAAALVLSAAGEGVVAVVARVRRPVVSQVS
ncbi:MULTISPECIES: MFS transporter [Microbacterium]|uniref:MFS transporter n=1 Tax=Microbacterium TaxID=33882 RepID=UPI0010F4D888|nr:MFS transporter [Microbacterium sp. 4NA327F11]MCK9916932.1 MFS transporter [Microbacteriaceae bacterium K1510]